jgi:hypothetical protein
MVNGVLGAATVSEARRVAAAGGASLLATLGNLM